MLDIQHNTAALFYKKARQVITYHLQQESSEMFEDCIKWDESDFWRKT